MTFDALLGSGRKPDLPGRVTAVLFGLNELRHQVYTVDEESENKQPYGLWYGRYVYAPHFLSDQRHPGLWWRQHFVVDLPDDSIMRFEGVTRLRPITPNPYGLSRKIHIVELTVNRGEGAGASQFVATDIRVLDGTPGFPHRVDDIAESLRARFDQQWRRHADGLKREFDRMEPITRKGLADDHGKTPIEQRPTSAYHSIYMRGDWDATNRRLRIILLRRIQGELAAVFDEDDEEQYRSFYVTMAATYEIDPTGTVVSETIHPPIGHDKPER